MPAIPLTYELGGVKLDSHTVNELLEQQVYVFRARKTIPLTHYSFHQHYFDHVPFIDIESSAESIHQTSEILLWALLLVSARNHPLYNQHFSQLRSAFHILLSEHVVRTIRCPYTVQALLLLCTWPMPVASQTDDPSWNYCSLAVSAVQQMGIHEPAHAEDSRPAHSMAYLKSWLACFVISTEYDCPIISLHIWHEFRATY